MQCTYTHPKKGQCPIDAMEGMDYCAIHCKGDPERLQKTQYNLAKYKYRKRYGDFLDSDELRSLHDEVALARMALEERLNLVQNDAEYIAACGTINTMFLTIERLVGTCHRLETSLGSLLSKPALLHIVQQIIDILLEELKDIADSEALIDRISDKILATILKAE
jgi:hypothetical protein